MVNTNNFGLLQTYGFAITINKYDVVEYYMPVESKYEN
jgi:hypothetical protein